VDYEIPEDILSKIPEYFWAAFAGELVSVFGLGIFEKGEYTNRNLCYVTGTGGWNAALKYTCRKLEIDWLYDYYDNLQWYESDTFDSDILDILVSEFDDDTSGHQTRFSYYTWLIKEDGDDQITCIM
jgi:hypothetical protein